MGFEDLQDPVNRAVAQNLGTPATWTPKGSGSPVSLRAKFNRRHVVFDVNAGVNVTTSSSSAWIRIADLPREPIEDDGFDVDGLSFVIVGFEPDGQGGALLVLERKSS